jgi:hypothetical protein
VANRAKSSRRSTRDALDNLERASIGLRPLPMCGRTRYPTRPTRHGRVFISVQKCYSTVAVHLGCERCSDSSSVASGSLVRTANKQDTGLRSRQRNERIPISVTRDIHNEVGTQTYVGSEPFPAQPFAFLTAALSRAKDW